MGQRVDKPDQDPSKVAQVVRFLTQVKQGGLHSITPKGELGRPRCFMLEVFISSGSLSLAFTVALAARCIGHRSFRCCQNIIREHSILVASLEQFDDQSRRLQRGRSKELRVQANGLLDDL